MNPSTTVVVMPIATYRPTTILVQTRMPNAIDDVALQPTLTVLQTLLPMKRQISRQ
jgi:hypothetical protein